MIYYYYIDVTLITFIITSNCKYFVIKLVIAFYFNANDTVFFLIYLMSFTLQISVFFLFRVGFDLRIVIRYKETVSIKLFNTSFDLHKKLADPPLEQSEFLST